MLTKFESTELQKMLTKMNLHDLSSLTGTITNGLITVTSKEDAMKAICQYANHPFDILKRKKITKKLIFDYLHSENVPVAINGDKYVFVTTVLQYWKSASNSANITEMEDVEIGTTVTASSVQLSSATSVQVSNNSGKNSKIMALSFGGWFYSLLNSVRETSSALAPEHFWPDCKLRTSMNSVEQHHCIVGSENVSSALKEMIVTHNIYLNPNLDEQAVQVQMESHGLTTIKICGTVIQGHNCIGTFDQCFGLIQDPNANNSWKVKFTELELRSSDRHIQ